jgi:hypothetical protein
MGWEADVLALPARSVPMIGWKTAPCDSTACEHVGNRA